MCHVTRNVEDIVIKRNLNCEYLALEISKEKNFTM